MTEPTNHNVSKVTEEPDVTPVREPLLTVALTVAAMVLVTWGILIVLGMSRTAQIREADAAIAQYNTKLANPEVKKTLSQYTALDTVSNQMDKLRSQRFLFLPAWETIKQSVPKDVQFTSVSISQDSVFRISGITKSVTSVAHFAKELSNQPTMEQVAPLSVDKQGNGQFNFTVSFKVKSTEAK